MRKHKFLALIGGTLLMLSMSACEAEETSTQGNALTDIPSVTTVLPTGNSSVRNEGDTNAAEPTQIEATTMASNEQQELPVLPSISIEAGTALDVSDFFSSDEEEELTILSMPSEDELRIAGAVYDVVVEYQGQKITVTVEIKDTTPPVIEGAEDLTVVAGETVSYKKEIVLSDNASGEILLTIDREAVDLNTPGEYPVTYTAEDAAGNKTEVQITVIVKNRDEAEKEQEVERLAEKLLETLISDDMSTWNKTYKIWNWCRTKIKYAYSAGDRSSITAGAYEGLHDRTGDCFAYYATFTYLLQKIGVETMEITRVGGTSNHWWNLVNLGDGWYHCDASPRRIGDPYRCFMQTDAQVQAYTDSYPEHPNYYVFDKTLYPERETTIIFGE